MKYIIYLLIRTLKEPDFNNLNNLTFELFTEKCECSEVLTLKIFLFLFFIKLLILLTYPK